MCLRTRHLGTWLEKAVCLFLYRGGRFMEKEFNYSILFKQAIQRIKCIRNPHAANPEFTDMKWDDVRNELLFDFGGNEHEKYERVITSAKDISLSCLHFIILKLGEIYGCQFKTIDAEIKIDKGSKIYFLIHDEKKDELLVFKELEECPGWKIKGREPEKIQSLMDEIKVKTCKYVYMVHDYAYLQMIGHNEDNNDPGRGYNLYGIKWFWENYFGEDEYQNFICALNEYKKQVNEYIGYAYIKTLGNAALINFRKITEYEITVENYDALLSKSQRDISGRTLSLLESDYKKIRKQFFDEQVMLVLIGKHDFAESLITAEWLYSSMKQAKAIDLTVIGTGYFKAVEQILYELICLHKDEGRKIKKNKSKDMVPLTEANILKKDFLDTTLGSMANFYKDNIDILRSDIGKARDYVRETIFAYAKVRNSYFHKHNIHDWNKIDEIRSATFQLLFLLLGAQQLSDVERKALGQVDTSLYDDYYKLCEYVNFHSNELFFINLGGADAFAIAVSDMYIETDTNDYIKYSGVYFKELGKDGRKFKFNKENLPKVIYTGKFVFAKTEMVGVEPVKRMKIYENGKFVGNSIVDEDKFSY